MDLFLANVKTAGLQVAILYILVAVGFIADKTGLYTQKTAKATTNLLFYIITPMVIINSFLNMEFSSDSVKGLLISFGIAIMIHVVAIIITIPFFNKKDDPDMGIYKFASVYGNVGYMALPLAQSVLGSEGVFYCSSGVIVFNILCFTQGAWEMTKNQEGHAKIGIKQVILSPGLISVIIGLPFYLLSINLPEIITTPVEYIASLNTPLAMIILGTYIANTDLKTLFTVKEHYIVLALKQIALPLIMILFFKLANIPDTIAVACSITAAAPPANNTVMFTAKYDKDIGKASKMIAFGSIFSIITMPIIIALAQNL